MLDTARYSLVARTPEPNQGLDSCFSNNASDSLALYTLSKQKDLLKCVVCNYVFLIFAMLFFRLMECYNSTLFCKDTGVVMDVCRFGEG